MIGQSDAAALATTRMMYPNPFLDLSRFFMPRTIKSLLKLCRIFFYRNEFVNNVITKLAEYPITELEIEGVDDEVLIEKYRELTNHHIKLKRLMIEIGLDYFTYGNCFISANMKFRRFLKCPNCGNSEPAERVKYRWQDFGFRGDCTRCQARGIKFELDDRPLKHPKYFSFVRWSPENINIDHDELTGENKYYYEMQLGTKKAILDGKKDIIERTPALFIEAVKHNRKILLDSNNLYHFKRATLAEEDQGWGKPLILSAMPMLWYMQTLRRGNEAIAADHLVPMRSLFPSSQGNIDPFCLSPEAWVYTADGVKQLKEITLNDKLITEAGQLTSIAALKSLQINSGSMYETSLYGLSAVKHISTDKHPYKLYDGKNYTWREAQDLNKGDYLAFPVKQFATKNAWLSTERWVPTLRAHKHVLPSKLRFTEDVARLFGLYLAEGCSAERGKVEFCFHSKEVEYQNHVRRVIDTWLPDTETKFVKGSGNYVQVQKYSVELQSFLAGLLGERCATKTLRNLGSLTQKQAIALLKGLYEGDGTFFYEQNKYPRLHLKSVNLGLLAEVRDLLLSLGFYPSIVKDNSYTDGKKVGPCYQLKLQGYQAEKLANLFGWEPRNYYNANDTSAKFKFLENMVLVQVEQVKKSKERNFIALEVTDPSHSYLTLGTISHNTQMNLGAWRSSVEDNLSRWRRDPNHIGVFPIPIGYQALGGDAKVLNVTPELKFLEELIINSFGVPTEFIKGGATWTSSSVSLRIVENHFLTYREEMHDFLNYFAGPKLAAFLDFPPAKFALKKFRMSDDIQHKEALIQLAQLNKITDSYLQAEFGLDVRENQKLAKIDAKTMIDLQIEQQVALAEVQGKQAVIMERYKAKAMEAFLEEQARLRERLFVIELKQELKATDQDPSDILQKYTAQIAGMDPVTQQQTLAMVQQQTPLTFTFIVQRLRAVYGGTPEQQAESTMREREMTHEKEIATTEQKHEKETQQHEEKKMEHESKKMEHEEKKWPHDERMAKEKAKAPAAKQK
jgi:hypothetical protein